MNNILCENQKIEQKGIIKSITNGQQKKSNQQLLIGIKWTFLAIGIKWMAFVTNYIKIPVFIHYAKLPN